MPKLFKPAQAIETEPRAKIPLKRVKSSQIAAIGYDPETKTLAVQFKPRAATGETPVPVYHYGDVSQQCADDFRGAESIGTYFGLHIKPLAFKKYPAEALPELEK